MFLGLCQNAYLCIMSKHKKQSHVVWKCDYHIVWCPKYRFRVLSGVIAELVIADILLLCEWKGSEVDSLSIQPDHIHMLISVPQKSPFLN